MLRLSVVGARTLDDGVWRAKLPSADVAKFASNNSTHTVRTSILSVENPKWDCGTGTLHFDTSNFVVLNVGTSDDAIFIENRSATLESDLGKPSGQSGKIKSDRAVARGDREFILLARKELSAQMAAVAEELLSEVRVRQDGELKRGQAKNFSETPDNFWYVILQPRIDMLSITIRGEVKHFSGVASLPIKDDRGNTLFKVTCRDDIPEALKLIFHAKRK